MNKTQKIAYIAVLAALSAIANIIDIPITTKNQLSFVYIPCFVAGILFGPLVGGAVGFFGDLLGCLIAPKGAFMPLIMLGTVMLGVIPGLIWRFLKIKDIWKLLISLVLTTIFSTILLNSLSVWYVIFSTKQTFWVFLAARLPIQLAVIAGNGLLIYAIIKSEAFIRQKYVVKNDNN